MKKSFISPLNIALALSLVTSSCVSKTESFNKDFLTTKPEIKANVTKPKAELVGKVDFENSLNKNNFKTKANISDIANNSTITLSYPSNNNFSKDLPLVTGISDSSGNFRLSPDSNFYPNVGEIFTLSATKRLAGTGTPLLSLQTYVKWNGNSWDSISFPNLVINTKTTALTLISFYNPTLEPDSTIKKLEVKSGLLNVVDINSTTATKAKILEVSTLVSSLLSSNFDPVRYIKFQNNTYIAKDNNYFGEMISGKVFDTSGTPVDGAKITATVLDSNIYWVAPEQLTLGGSYVFKDVPIGAKILITVTKDGWTKRERIEVVKSNLLGGVALNKFNFDGIYAIQDEPELTSLKINGALVTNSGSLTTSTSVGEALKTATANLGGVDNGNLEVEMSFSEPIRTDDIQNFFRITSQNFSVKNNTNFTIDNNLSGITWSWSNDDKTVKFSTNGAILANTTGSEAKYLIDFSQPFRDKTDKETLKNKMIRFDQTNSSDFNIFSVKNDQEAPKILSITAIDGGNSLNDKIELKFNEPMLLINKYSAELSLADPLETTNKNRQLCSMKTNNVTLLGYTKVDNSTNLSDFRVVYTIGRIAQPISGASFLQPLNISSITNSVKVNQSSTFSSRINKDKVTLEFVSTAFDKNDILIVSVGKNITGRYKDITSTPNIDFSIEPTNTALIYSSITDPAGQNISVVNETTSSNITSNDSQKVSIVN